MKPNEKILSDTKICVAQEVSYILRETLNIYLVGYILNLR